MNATMAASMSAFRTRNVFVASVCQCSRQKVSGPKPQARCSSSLSVPQADPFQNATSTMATSKSSVNGTRRAVRRSRRVSAKLQRGGVDSGLGVLHLHRLEGLEHDLGDGQVPEPLP